MGASVFRGILFLALLLLDDRADSVCDGSGHRRTDAIRETFQFGKKMAYLYGDLSRHILHLDCTEFVSK